LTNIFTQHRVNGQHLQELLLSITFWLQVAAVVVFKILVVGVVREVIYQAQVIP
jgi:hypothetical protein